jgi:hypothetical protein
MSGTTAEAKKEGKNAGLVSLWVGRELKEDFKRVCLERGYSQSMIARMLLGQWISKKG